MGILEGAETGLTGLRLRWWVVSEKWEVRSGDEPQRTQRATEKW